MKTLLTTLCVLCWSSIYLFAQDCVLSINHTVGTCDANGMIEVVLTVNDPNDEAKEIEILVDGEAIPGGPFDIDDDDPVVMTILIPGDGLDHTILATSVDEDNCEAEVVIPTDDCSSDCFISAVSVSKSSGQTHVVDVGDNFFSPTTTTITIGDIVRWEWVAGGHTTTSDATSGPDSWNSGERGTGATYEFTINNPGVHPYYCVPHGGPGGVGMAAQIVANCPDGNQIEYILSFSTAVADPAGYDILIDGQPLPGSPFDYTGTGNQTRTFTLAGDGQPHTVTVQDVTDPSCSIDRSITIPDCGAAPSCQLSVSAALTGGCTPADEVPVELSVSAINAGDSGFRVLIDGQPSGTFSYAASGATVVSVSVSGDGQAHTLTVEDIADPACSASAMITTTNCTEPCIIQNLTAGTGGGTIHTVEVRDFAFAPRDITITAGDRVEWVWTGAVAHTTTSDATSGPDSWDSGLLDQGATFLSPVLSAGVHPYYCIPHGAPGGVGMAGTITVQPDCTNGEVGVTLDFTASGGGFNGYEVLVDGTSAGTFAYAPDGNNSAAVFVPGDGAQHQLTVQDRSTEFCAATTVFTASDCNATNDCTLSDVVAEPLLDRVHEVDVTDFVFAPRDITIRLGDTARFVWTGQVPHTTTSDATSGPNSWDSGLLGNGAVYDVVLTEPGYHPYYCIPHGGPGGIGMAGSITVVDDCADGQRDMALSFVGPMAGTGYRVWVDDTLTTDSPYPYTATERQSAIVSVPADGEPHLIRIADLETTTCRDSVWVTVPSCVEGCGGFAGDFALRSTGGDGLQAAFEDRTTGNPNAWLWGFGDGTTSTERNPTHTYAEPGTYTICLVVRNTDLSCSLTICRDEYIGTTAVDAPPAATALRVIPNPVLRDRAIWRVRGLEPGVLPEIVLFGADGRIHRVGGLHWERADLIVQTTGLPAGLYVLRIIQNGRLYTAKLLVQ